MKSMKTLLIAALLTSLALLQGCGSSSDDNSVATTTISGSVVAAPVAGASVLVKNSAGATVAGPVTSLADGTYTINIPNSALVNELHFEATGGTFTDEATGTAGVAASRLAACIAGGTLTTTPVVHIDPASTIIQGLVSRGTPLNKAKNAFNMAFGFIPDPSIDPDPTATSLHQRLAALRAAAFSQLTQDLGLLPGKQFSLLEAISKDLADGKLDGIDASGPVNIDTTTPLSDNTKTQFTTALETMRTKDFSDVTSDQLSSVIAYTVNYKVEVVNPDGIKSAKVGKTSFTLKFTNRSDDTPASGQSIKLIPYMHMVTKDHSSPVDEVTDNGDGTYSCTVYYLMMTMMDTQEYWELQVKINDTETATFFPNVGMAMGAGPVRLYGSTSDMVASMGTMEPAKRTYLLFKDSVSAATNTFNLFLVTRDDALMMKFPAVSGGSTLTDSTGTTWNVVPATSSVQISTDNLNYVNATDNGNGHWSTSDPSLNLAPGATVYVKVTINGEVKTDIAGTTGYGTFTLPSM